MGDNKTELLNKIETLNKETELKCTKALQDLLKEMNCSMVSSVELTIGGKNITVPLSDLITGTPVILIKAN